VDVARAARASGSAVLGFAPSGLPGPKGNRETFVWLAEHDRVGALDEGGIESAALAVEP
jgi:23S rRNA (cytidine1920-2'-O)/16S rRNA (cytidine1409-2'-O)-methyltransferase